MCIRLQLRLTPHHTKSIEMCCAHSTRGEQYRCSKDNDNKEKLFFVFEFKFI